MVFDQLDVGRPITVEHQKCTKCRADLELTCQTIGDIRPLGNRPRTPTAQLQKLKRDDLASECPSIRSLQAIETMSSCFLIDTVMTGCPLHNRFAHSLFRCDEERFLVCISARMCVQARSIHVSVSNSLICVIGIANAPIHEAIQGEQK